jgi:hypothetical protein
VPIALDTERPPGQRLRALSLVRSSRWVHLATLLQARKQHELRARLDGELATWIAHSGRIGRAPAPEIRQQIEERLPELDPAQRRQIEFVLRTAV